MTKVNTHGMKMHGLKVAAGVTRDAYPYSGHYVQISYDTNTGYIYAHWNVDVNSWMQYDNPAIFTAVRATRHMTMQQIADAIAEAVADRAALAARA